MKYCLKKKLNSTKQHLPAWYYSIRSTKIIRLERGSLFIQPMEDSVLKYFGGTELTLIFTETL